jgi:hypothetical protein
VESFGNWGAAMAMTISGGATTSLGADSESGRGTEPRNGGAKWLSRNDELLRFQSRRSVVHRSRRDYRMPCLQELLVGHALLRCSENHVVLRNGHNGFRRSGSADTLPPSPSRYHLGRAPSKVCQSVTAGTVDWIPRRSLPVGKTSAPLGRVGSIKAQRVKWEMIGVGGRRVRGAF